MRSFRYFSVLATAIIALSVAGVSAQSFSGGKKQSGKSIEQQVYKKLKGMTRYGVFDHITFEVNGSTVVLEGKVNSLGVRREAESTVKRIPGVSRVINNIDELPPSSFDEQIRRQALRTFASNGLYRYFWEIDPEVRIIVEGGRITLEGYVANKGDYNRLNIYANGITGVFSVKNNLIVGKPLKA